jgi:hypothetical protein
MKASAKEAAVLAFARVSLLVLSFAMLRVWLSYGADECAVPSA